MAQRLAVRARVAIPRDGDEMAVQRDPDTVAAIVVVRGQRVADDVRDGAAVAGTAEHPGTALNADGFHALGGDVEREVVTVAVDRLPVAGTVLGAVPGAGGRLWGADESEDHRDGGDGESADQEDGLARACFTREGKRHGCASAGRPGRARRGCNEGREKRGTRTGDWSEAA